MNQHVFNSGQVAAYYPIYYWFLCWPKLMLSMIQHNIQWNLTQQRPWFHWFHQLCIWMNFKTILECRNKNIILKNFYSTPLIYICWNFLEFLVSFDNFRIVLQRNFHKCHFNPITINTIPFYIRSFQQTSKNKKVSQPSFKKKKNFKIILNEWWLITCSQQQHHHKRTNKG